MKVLARNQIIEASDDELPRSEWAKAALEELKAGIPLASGAEKRAYQTAYKLLKKSFETGEPVDGVNFKKCADFDEYWDAILDAGMRLSK